MNNKILGIAALFALVVVGFVLAAVPNEAAQAEAQPNVYDVESPYSVIPMAGCTRVCTNCLKYGHNGACSLSGACC